VTARTFTRLLGMAVVASGALAGACAPVSVNSYTPPRTDVTAYRTYAWAAGELGATGDPRLDNNSFFRERVQLAADGQLSFRGYQKVTSGAPDLTVHIHARLQQRLDSSALDSVSCQREECHTEIYDEGTLLIDLVDTRTNALVWRGWAERSLDGVIDNQEWMNQVIDRAVQSIFSRLPMRHS
jgi:hypothetical protein